MNKLVAWLAVATWMAIIFYLSHQPASDSAELSLGVMHVIMTVVETIAPNVELDSTSFHFIVRKGAHFIAYFVLGMLLLHALRTSGVRGWRSIVFALVIAALYAISDEVHQLFVPGRGGQVRDVLIDSTGASVGIIIYSGLHYLLKRKRR